VERIGLAGVLRARHISKSFAATRALDDVAISVARAEIHGLIGENGSGKSTLIKILAGYHAPDPGGELTIGNRPVRLPLRPGQPRELGLRFVHQNLGLIPSLSVVENLLLDELAAARRRPVSWSRERRRARETFARFGIDLDPRAMVGGLSPAGRAQLSTVRALAETPIAGQDQIRPVGLLVLDETAAYLPAPERERFFALLRTVAAGGISVLLVSHDLGEARAISDRITVLRNGRNVATVAAGALQTHELVELVTGQDVSSPPIKRSARPGGGAVPQELGQPICLTGLVGDSVAGLSLSLHPGEIVGLTGPAGSGFEEVPYLIFGAGRCAAGKLKIDHEHDLTAMTPARALRAGIALLPGDRQRDGVVDSLTVEANISLPVLDRHVRGLGLRKRQLTEDARRLLAEYQVRPNTPGAAMETLSGGNQQKVLLAKWIQLAPALLLLHEPTRGVDVGARREIFATLRGLARRGVAVMCASGDHEELAALCDRVLVFGEGAPVRTLIEDQISVAQISAASLSHPRPAPPRNENARSAER
jgi:ribose transport system ATP-binding protein